MRNTTAPRPTAMVLAGISSRMRCCSGSRQNGTKPPAGTQRSFCAKIRIAIVPTTNTGTDRPRPAAPASIRSIAPPARSAASVPSGNPNRTAIRLAAKDQLQRARQPQRDLLRDGMIVEQRTAEIAFQQTADIAEILRQDRPVEAELLAQFHHRGGIRRDAALGEQQFGRIAGDEVNDQEDERDDAQMSPSATAIRVSA